MRIIRFKPNLIEEISQGKKTNNGLAPFACQNCQTKYGSQECVGCEPWEEERMNEGEDDP